MRNVWLTLQGKQWDSVGCSKNCAHRTILTIIALYFDTDLLYVTPQVRVWQNVCITTDRCYVCFIKTIYSDAIVIIKANIKYERWRLTICFVLLYTKVTGYVRYSLLRCYPTTCDVGQHFKWTAWIAYLAEQQASYSKVMGSITSLDGYIVAKNILFQVEKLSITCKELFGICDNTREVSADKWPWNLLKCC